MDSSNYQKIQFPIDTIQSAAQFTYKTVGKENRRVKTLVLIGKGYLEVLRNECDRRRFAGFLNISYIRKTEI